MTQVARIISAGGGNPVEVHCIRDEARVMTIPCRSWRDSDVLADAWNSNATQARMAELIKELGLKL